ncbi:MAG: sulfatase-like hydrolase/transferase [Bacteroidota bacterium]
MVKYTYLLGAFLLLISCQSQEQLDETAQSSLPNILFLFTDDQTYHSIQALGNEEIRTPNLDRLADMGTTFTHAYNMGGWHGAICVASRSMMISGRSIWRARAIEKQWNERDSLAMQQTWGQLMSKQGYETYMSGKWHIAVPTDTVFQHLGTVQKGGMPPDAWTTMSREARERMNARFAAGEDFHEIVPIGYARPKNEADQTWLPTDTARGGFWTGGQHWSEVLRDDAINFLEEATQKDAPFFMYLAFNAPHDSRQAPQEFLDLYDVDEVQLPENWLPEYPFKDQIGCHQLLRDEALAPFPRTPYAIRKHRQEYYAIISHLDAQIGKILDHLEASGAMENTYIFFSADHGLSVGQHGLLGKQSLFDHSIRVPMIAVGKEFPKGKQIHTDVYLQDIMATSLDLARIEQAEYVDFNSLLPLVQGEQNERETTGVYGAYMDYQRMIRKEDYKLILYPEVPKTLLFDLKNDPLERKDLSKEPAQQERIASLFKDLQQLQVSMKDTLDLSPYFPESE